MLFVAYISSYFSCTSSIDTHVDMVDSIRFIMRMACLWGSGSRFQVPGSRFQVPGSRFQVPGSRFQVLLDPENRLSYAKISTPQIHTLQRSISL